jgi:protein-S-isoprenylcysteine O-methyltransferase Ste14
MMEKKNFARRENMTFRFFISAIAKFTLGVLLVGACIFLPAGSLSFFGGWLLMGILFIPMLGAGLVMMFKNPALLARRLDAKEKRKTQDTVVKLSGLMFILGFVLAGLDFRFSWLPLPRAVSIGAAVVFLVAYLLYAEVLRENTYLSRTVKVEAGQRVVDTGLYGIVRHPMYSVTLLLFLSMPLVLGSLFALIPFLAYPFIITVRLRNEEKLLEAELDGYTAYQKKVKWRLIPFIY